VLALLGASPSVAQTKPQPCDGKFLITDAAGDQGASQQGVPIFATPESTDVLGLFFHVDGEKVTANIVVSDLTPAPPAGFDAIRYRAYATVGGEVQYFQALVGSSGATYSYGGTFELTYTQQGETTGTLYEGKNGIISLVIPPDVGGKPGTRLAATSATAGLLTAPVPPEVQLAPFYFQADTAPNESADGPGTNPAACAPPEATPATGVPAATPPTITLKKSALSAKKVNSKRSMSVVLRSTGDLTSVTAKLKRGSTILGSGKLASLSGSGTLKLKLKQKTKKGSYTLAVTAKGADGAKVAKSFKLKFRA
jgi:hypothetical protein